jgi:hypothetical protein
MLKKLAGGTALAALALAAVVAGNSAKADPATGATIAGAIAADRAKANLEGAKSESTAAGAVVKGTTGISVDAIKKNGVFGGSNSIFRKPFG